MEIGEQRRLCIASSHENIRRLAKFCCDSCQDVFSPDQLYELELAVVEAAHNIFEHAYQEEEGYPLELDITREPHCIKLVMIDAGSPFEKNHASYLFELYDDIDDVPEDGYGLKLIHECMDEVSYLHEEGLNTLILKKRIGKPSIRPNMSMPFISRHTAELAEKLDELEHTRNEMAIATNMHKHLVSRMLPNVPGLLLYAKSESALQVGGDYLTFSKHKDNSLWFMICDAMGKGMSAAFFSILAHMTFQSVLFLQEGITPGELLSLSNIIMNDDFDRFGMFMTALVGRIDLAKDSLQYASAGHCQPILYTDEKGVELLETDDFMLGVAGNMSYRTYSTKFLPGMKLLTYTDGITDIIGPDGEMVGVEPLLWACEDEFAVKDIASACKKIFGDVMLASGNKLQDDISMIGIERIVS